jgi:DNA polymerase-1
VHLRFDFDAQLAHYIFDENQDHDLKYVSRIELDCPEYDIPKELKLSDKPEWLERMKDPANREKYWRYNGQDGWNTLHLSYKYSKMLRNNAQLRRLYNHLVMPSAYALQNIEAEGMPLDFDKYREVEARITLERQAAIDALDKRVGAKAGEINWGSRDQVAHVLYEQLKLPVRLKTPTGQASTSEEAIVDLKGKHPIINELLKYRELDKILGTYLNGWKQYITNGRIYFSYKQHGTVTGRFSSRLHQIPTDGDIRSIISGVEM